ncbi:hypothetical protein GCK32_010575 [Trichostrongylus colubriformis]|uniref:Fibronectin type-III domain-containing protein n=1 Tax=Trichostrongylus colubriformis TaxID=6319 RepID=A0AAN8F971_TRICO
MRIVVIAVFYITTVPFSGHRHYSIYQFPEIRRIRGLITSADYDFPTLKIRWQQIGSEYFNVLIFCKLQKWQHSPELSYGSSLVFDMKFDIKLYDDTKCKPVFPNVSVVVVNFHNESIYDVVELTPVRKVRVFDFSGAEAEGRVVAHFKVMHPQSLRDREFLIRRTRIYNGEETVMNWLKATTNKTLVEWQIEARPERYRVVLEPVIHEKEEAYIKADPRNLTIQIDVKELAPTDAPTEVEVTELLDVVYVDFEPIPEEKIPGKDAGCEVRLCENPELVESCEVKRLPPRSPTAEYRRLKPSTIYHVSVACMTGGGMGPRSPWITFTTGQLKKKSPRTTTSTVPTTTIAVSGVLVSIEASRGMNVILTLGFKMKDGSKFYDGFVRYLELLQYRRVRSSLKFVR